MTLDALGRDEDGNLYINELSQLYERVIRYNVLSDQPSHQLWTGAQLAIPFTPEVEGKHIKVTLRLQRYSIGRIRALIYESDDTGLPDISKEIGRYFATDYSELQTTFTEVTWEIDLGRNLNPSKTYYLVLYGYSESYYIQAEYADSPGESNYLLSTDNGSTWTAYDRTPLLEIEGAAPVGEGSVTIAYNNIANFKKHGNISFELLESENSYYEADMLDLEGNIIKPNIEVGSYLFDDNLGKDTKLKIKIIRALGEDPRLADYEHMWVADMSSNRLEQAIVPSDDIIFYYPSAKTGPATIYAHISEGGRYRLKGEIKTNDATATVSATITIYENNHVSGAKIGFASVKGNVYTPVTIDLDSVSPNGKIAIVLATSNSSYPPSIRYIKICGEYGYQKIELTGV